MKSSSISIIRTVCQDYTVKIRKTDTVSSPHPNDVLLADSYVHQPLPPGVKATAT